MYNTIMAGNTSIVCNNELVWETEIITNIILLKQEKISLESHKKKLDEQRRFGNTGHLILVTRLTDETINIIKAAEDEYYLLRGAISVEGVDSAFLRQPGVRASLNQLMDTLSLINDHLAITQQSSLPSDELKATVREIAVITENVKRIIILLSLLIMNIK
ncbi:ORF48 [Ostreid herpesvirus 1]|uniref:Uncharacterized protein ORF48 n=1 Tax=Ostreid herpesvirus 1 (isolate France) TaxID=654903 RepID=Y048_OSHVF|nr:ORF48 [Ostreid herpesvirus 1]Q6R7H6.1 RecName: Full=Uncharacterized protein ORF48 [Ostreid herpesvirus 1 (isolate France)]AAS00939.1 ORF48 [Ostreid herpesvirus 1]AVQ67826.1 ORF48 [Ostreid herpesvirus 1]